MFNQRDAELLVFKLYLVLMEKRIHRILGPVDDK